MKKNIMKKSVRFFALTVLAVHLMLMTGCVPLVGGILSLTAASFGAGYWTAVQTMTTTTEYYIDGQRVQDPAALGLE